ncbi:coth protein-domain-containing protein [Neocallimastix lanati (nom. inval.)]|nr:coth protein-domain-containing protein [Neocallimastix sp. JGI-2020a]
MNITSGKSYNTPNEFFQRPTPKEVNFLPEIWENPYNTRDDDVFDINNVNTFYLTVENATQLELMNQFPHHDIKIRFTGDFYSTHKYIPLSEEDWQISITGNYSRMFTKQSFKISYKGEEDPKFELKKFKLKGFPNDATMLREPISVELLKKVGIPTYRGAFSRLYINNDYYGLYYYEDTMEKVYIKNLFHSKGKKSNIGPLFQAIPYMGNYNASLNYIDDQALSYPNWNQTWDCKINGTEYGSKEESFTSLINFMKKLNQTDFTTINENELLHSVYDVFELDIFIRLLAMDYLLGRFHGYWRNPSNFLIYYHPPLKRYVIFPVDFTSSLGYKYDKNGYTYKTEFNEWRLSENPNDPLLNIVMNNSYLYDLFTKTVKLIIVNLFNSEILFPFIDSLRDVIKFDLEMERRKKPYHSKTSVIEQTEIKQTKVENVEEDANGFPSNSTIDTTIIIKKNTTLNLIEPNWTIEKSLTAIDDSVSDIGYGIKEWISRRSEFVSELLEEVIIVSAGSLITRPSDPSNLYSDSIFDYFETIFPPGKYNFFIFFLIFLLLLMAIVFVIHLKYKKPTVMEGDEHDLRKYDESFFHKIKTRFNFINNNGLFFNLSIYLQNSIKNLNTRIRNLIYHKSRNID